MKRRTQSKHQKSVTQQKHHTTSPQSETTMAKPNLLVPKHKHQQLELLAIAKERQDEKIKHDTQLKIVLDYFKKHRWWLLANTSLIYDRETGLLWENLKESRETPSANVTNFIKVYKVKGLSDWRIPKYKEIMNLVGDHSFPLRNGAYKEILGAFSVYVDTQNSGTNAIWLDKDYPRVCYHDNSHLYLVNDVFLKSKDEAFFLECAKRGWNIKPYSAPNDDAYTQFSRAIQFVLHYHQSYIPSTPKPSVIQTWQNIDYISTRLPKLDSLRFTDIEQGMWEFYIPNHLNEHSLAIESEQYIRPRNPELDIQEGAKVAIDFGTSSTVVAIRRHGQDELLRIGMQEKDFNRNTINESDFENPTILELLDIQKLLITWHKESYRPLVDWNTVHCSHEARTRFRENDTDPRIVGSMFTRLKQWALRDATQAKVRITDSKEKYEYEFAPLTEYNPVKGSAIQLDKNYPQLDPIELYAWFLGMNINWRERGIFLKYYMTFPVAYPNDVKEKILASFRRGLQRSLPESLIYSERFNEFSVQELASEPAAFAAAALRTLQVEPTKEGTAYAVFDFGGGTTDFDYGIYREPTDDEYDEGYDDVIEHFGSSGDKFLGGENLLENLAYLVFKSEKNQNTCREKQISFTKPLDAGGFVGSERLVSQTQAAYTNTTLLMSKLRPLWEKGEVDITQGTPLKVSLLNRQGERVECEIVIPQQELIEFLQERIRTGLKGFFMAMKSSFNKQLGQIPEQIHLLLAGNSSRSRIVRGLLACLDDADEQGQVLQDLMVNDLADVFGEENLPTFEIHEPLPSDPQNPYKPNTKTGVALGLLRVSPGETLKVINHAQQADTDSPFQFYVGSHRRDKFTVGIKRGDAYGEWKELGAIRQGMFPLLYTTQPQAESEEGIMRGTHGLREQNLEFSGQDIQGKKVFAKIISPDTIELGLAESLEQAEHSIQRREILLKI